MSDRCTLCGAVPNPDGSCACKVHEPRPPESPEECSSCGQLGCAHLSGCPAEEPIQPGTKGRIETPEEREARIYRDVYCRKGESDLDYFFRRHAELTKPVAVPADPVARLLVSHVTRIVAALKKKWSVGNSSRFCDDAPEWDEASEDEIKQLIIDTLIHDETPKAP